MSYKFDHTPRPPAFVPDWPAIAALPWVHAMAGVQQEPQWHAEGDVLTHTHLVAQAMAASPRWQASREQDQHVLFAAALLHDVAKPIRSRLEEGRWTSPKHAKVGEGMARHLLWTGCAGSVPSFYERERVAKLVRHHGLPLRFTEKPDPSRALTLASLEVNLNDVAELALADVVGRECEGKGQLIESVQLFRDYAAELDCLHGQRPFEHDHHRFVYCVGGKPIEYVPHRPAGSYGTDAFEVVLMSGLPGSGKSTIARKMAGERPVIDLDAIRQQLGVDGADDQSPVVAEARERAKAFLRARQSFVWDATNITREMRSKLIGLFANYGAVTRIVYVEAPSWEAMFARNRSRSRPVPEDVVHRLAGKLEIPSPAEAHRVEYVV